MLTIQLIRENPDFVVKRLAIKNFDATDAVKKILSLDEKRVAIQQELNAKQAEINSLSKEIGTLFSQKKVDEANAAKEKTGEIKGRAEPYPMSSRYRSPRRTAPRHH